FAVAVEITRADDRPSWNAVGRDPVPAEHGVARGASHIDNGHLSRRIVLRHDVRLAVAVEIGDAGDVPPWISCRRQPGPALHDVALRTSHVPDDHLTRLIVDPHEIHHAVAVEVASTLHAPAG